MTNNNNRIEAVRLTTPVGVAKWPHLVNVDPHESYGGDYSVQLLLDNESAEAQEFVAKIEQLRDEMHKQMQANMGRKKPWNTPHFPVTDDLDQDGNESGFYSVKLKSKGSYERGGQTIERKVSFFDASGQKIGNPAQAFGGEVPMGSKIAAAIQVAPYQSGANFGVSLRIEAIQVIELGSSNAPASAEARGFTVHDGGFAAPAAPTFEESEIAPF
jgi:hypothetical protein